MSCRMGVLMLGLMPVLAFAKDETSYPMLMSLSPVAAQTGQTTEHSLKARYSMHGAFEVFVSGTGIKGDIVLPESKPGEKPKVQELNLRFTVAADATPGVRDFRIATPRGASTVGQLVVTSQPIFKESGDNDAREKAQAITLPIALCGAVEKNEDVDWFRFSAAAGQALTFHVRAQRIQDRIHDLQNHVDPLITIRNAQGTTIAANDNFHYGDPFLHQRFEQAGDYFLEVRDVRYQGNQYWEYCIEISDQPFVTSVFPSAVTAGHVTKLQFVGYDLPANSDAILRLADEQACGPLTMSLPMGGRNMPVPLVVTQSPVFVENAADNNSLATAHEVALPAVISGRIEHESDIDHFAFAAMKGETFSIEVVARRQQSALDSHLRILDDKGNQLALNDDMRLGKRGYADSWIESWSAPADGRYLLELRDLHGRGGPEFVYAIQATRAVPGFRLWLDTDKTQLTPGTGGVFFVRAERRNGFAEEIQLQVDGLPRGATASCGKILAKGMDGCVILQTDPNATFAASNLKVTGTATQAGPSGQKLELRETALPYQEIYQPGGGRGHWPVEMHTACIGERGDLWAVLIGEREIKLKPSESKAIDVVIARSPGFDKNVTLDVTYNHLEQIHADALPLGVKLDRGKSQTLLTGTTSAGIITLTAAKDAAPCERQQVAVMANVSINFVMKATYCAAPLFVTVESP